MEIDANRPAADVAAEAKVGAAATATADAAAHAAADARAAENPVVTPPQAS